MGANANPSGTITGYNTFVRHLTIPLSIPLAIDLNGTILHATVTGQIVAVEVPEPSTLLMAGVALISLVTIVRHRRSHGRVAAS